MYENTWIATALLDDPVRDYLNAATFSYPLPTWELAPDQILHVSAFQVWTETVRVPLEIREK